LNAPVVWIAFPLSAAIVLYIIRRWERAMHLAGLMITLSLAWLAWQLPIGEPVSLRLWAGVPPLRIAESVSFLGQQFTLDNASRPYVLMIYLMTGFWFGGAFAARVNRYFIPFSLSIAGMLVAAVALKTSTYASLVIGINVLLAVPFLSPPGKAMSRGVLRLIIFYTIGTCLLLISEKWLLVSMISSSNSTEFPVGLISLAIGYSLLLAVFPFFSWIPMLIEEADPYSAAFIFFIFPVGVSFLLIHNINHYSLLGVPPVMFTVLQAAGITSIIVGSIWGMFERNLGRLFGFSALTQIGLLMIMLGSVLTQKSNSSGLLFFQVVAMGIGMALWALSLSAIRIKTPDLSFSSLRGIAYRLPVASSCLVLAQFSLFGLPLLASFPIYMIIWSSLAQISWKSVLVLLLCSASLMSASLRTIVVVLQENAGANREINEDTFQRILLVMGGLALLVIGLMPKWLISPLMKLGGL